jgi:peroxiredoxin
MAATESNMLPLGTPAPLFSLPEVATGEILESQHFAKEEALLVIFLCAHCPYVLHIAPELANITKEYADKPVKFLGITANDTTQYPQDAPEPTAQFAKHYGLSFPILFDEAQKVAHAYAAACTHDFFLFDKQHNLFYRGQMDDSRPGRGTPTGTELRAALDAVLSGHPAPDNQRPSIGCNIKWKPGNTPNHAH